MAFDFVDYFDSPNMRAMISKNLLKLVRVFTKYVKNPNRL